MKKQLYYLTILIGLTLLVKDVFAQTAQTAAIFKRAEKEYTQLRYAYAIPLLEDVLKAEPANKRALEMMADAQRKVKNYVQAEAWYAKLTVQTPLRPQWALHYAEVLANNQKYNEAEKWYKNYLVQVRDDQRATAFTEAYPNVSSFMLHKKRWNIGFANINTQMAEYAPMYFDNGLLFVSNRKTDVLTKNVFAWDQTPFSDLYAVKSLDKIKSVNVDSIMLVAKGDIKRKAYRINNDDTRKTSNDSKTFVDGYQVLNDTLAKALGSDTMAVKLGNINTKYHEGPVALLPGGALIFTRNNYFNGKAKKSSDGIIKLKMFTADPPMLDNIKPFAYNSDEYSVGHPALNETGTLLIFASDMPGGFGGTDLYYCTRASIKEEWGKPVNMGKAINTEGDELFPTLYQDKTLFFSSTGHPGLGGLDIFEVSLDGFKVVSVPANLGAPINSSVDDFSLVRSKDGVNGFFSSNRRGNDDIYAFNYKDYRIILKGRVTDGDTGKPISNTNVMIQHKGERLNIKTDADGNYLYELPKDATTNVHFSALEYYPKNFDVSTHNIDADTIMVRNIALVKPIKSAGLITKTGKDCEDIKQFGKKFILYFDLDKSNIRKDAATVADALATFLKANPQFDVFASSYCDSRASNAYNIRLSERRSLSVKNYLVNKGISAGRIKISYHGENNLVNHCGNGINCTEEEQQLNRRTEFFLTFKGKKIAELDCEALIKGKN